MNSANIQMDSAKFRKMMFLYNAINDGWSVKRQHDSYVFRKKHEGKQEVFLDTYLTTFVSTNLDAGSLLSNK
jgi:hypothetical protein